MKIIYILLTRSDTYLSRFIGFFTSDRYTHASISFAEGLQPLYSFSRKRVYLPLPAGLRHEPLKIGFYKKHSKIPCALYKLTVSEEVYNSAKDKVDQMMLSDKKYRFSIMGLLLCGIKIPYHRKNHYFCSEFVSEILSKSNALQLPKRSCLMRPNDYTKLPELSCEFEGPLNELLQTKTIA